MSASRSTVRLSAPVVAAFWLLASGPAAAQAAPENPAAADPEITIDLNRLDPSERGCRVHLVIANDTPHDFSRFEVDWVFFDGDGVISERTALEVAPLLARRTSVKQFVIDRLDCAAIDSALINGVTVCDSAEGPVADCLRLVEPMSRGGVTLRR
ncbi:MAG: Tat pathway signal sequence domain protein [Alphaproteobacteria bacterium]|nr:Tat pathway signal sequence domain protein [Alphaproteobacteria bacterium]